MRTATVLAEFKRVPLRGAWDDVVPIEREVTLEYDGRVVQMRGGPTGHESFVVQDTEADHLEMIAERGWMACFGTPGRWDQCRVQGDEMRRALTELGII